MCIRDSPKGIYYDDLAAWKQETGSVINFPGSEFISNEDLLELDVTVLMPSALENVITAANADRVKAKIITEPVSYTHLDVYKRQRPFFSMMVIRSARHWNGW